MHPTPVPATSGAEPGAAGRPSRVDCARCCGRSGWCRRCGRLVAIALGLLVAPARRAGPARRCCPSSSPATSRARAACSRRIAGAMISVTGLVFSNTMVVLQLASSQFSPRVLQTFLEDRVTQHTLGVFTASFVYALTVLRSLADAGDDPVPQLAVTLSFAVRGRRGRDVLGLHQPHHRLGGDLQRAAPGRRGDPRPAERGRSAPTRAGPRAGPTCPTWATSTSWSRPRSGYLDALDLGDLRTLAIRNEARIEILHPLGTFIVECRPLAMVHGAGARRPAGTRSCTATSTSPASGRCSRTSRSGCGASSTSPSERSPPASTTRRPRSRSSTSCTTCCTGWRPSPIRTRCTSTTDGIARLVTREPTFSSPARPRRRRDRALGPRQPAGAPAAARDARRPRGRRLARAPPDDRGQAAPARRATAGRAAS